MHTEGSQSGTTLAVVHLGSNGGGPKFTLEMTKALQRAGHPTIAVVARGADNLAAFVETGPTLAVPTFASPAGALLRSPLILLNALKLRRALAEAQVDALIVSMEQVWQAPILWLGRGRRPVLLCVHDATMHPGDHNRLEEMLRAVQRRTADGALTFSAHVASALVAAGTFPARRVWRTVHGTYGDIGEQAHSAVAADSIPTIGFFGRISRYKGLGLCLEAVNLLRSSGRRVRFSVVGNGDVDVTGAMTHEDDDVRLEWVPDAEIPSVLSGFDVLALPYVEASQSGVFAYAIGQGLPMVVTPVGGLKEQATETEAALVARAVTAEAFADELERLLDDPDLYGRVAERGLHAAVGTHSWERVAHDTTRAVQELIGASAGR